MNIVILAAGQGKRMHSDLAKVLHPVAGRPMLAHVLETARRLVTPDGPAEKNRIIVVYGHGGEAVRAAFPDEDLLWALQEKQLGTGHALASALPLLDPDAPTLVLSGDVPLVEESTLHRLSAAAADGRTLALLTVEPADATGYGRIVRDAGGRIVRIVEHKDANESELALREINTGIMVLPTARLEGWLKALSSDNANGEYYLTDIIGFAVGEGIAVAGVPAAGEWEVLGINSKAQLAGVERVWQRRFAASLLERGVQLADPDRIDVRGRLNCGRDVFIDINCLFIGEVELGDGVRVGPNAVLADARIGAGTQINAFSYLEDARVGSNCTVGPYARLRPGTVLESGAHIGNFVEVKKSHIGAGSKANHLAYIGDAQVGERVNIGAGTITCNYDGTHKHQTIIGDDVFIGSDTQLVAPVTIGARATVAAGTTVTQDVAANALVLSRTPQIVKSGWVKPAKKNR